LHQQFEQRPMIDQEVRRGSLYAGGPTQAVGRGSMQFAMPKNVHVRVRCSIPFGALSPVRHALSTGLSTIWGRPSSDRNWADHCLMQVTYSLAFRCNHSSGLGIYIVLQPVPRVPEIGVFEVREVGRVLLPQWVP
jgi:hypothetical protein